MRCDASPARLFCLRALPSTKNTGARPDLRDRNHRSTIQFASPHPAVLWACELALRSSRWRDYKVPFSSSFLRQYLMRTDRGACYRTAIRKRYASLPASISPNYLRVHLLCRTPFLPPATCNALSHHRLGCKCCTNRRSSIHICIVVFTTVIRTLPIGKRPRSCKYTGY